ncbi:MAG: Rrf2 family transcriptional regulator [Chloroflexota bacterium]|nr:Rrf2 family transcriptional regulator [Chloroflexota bacterium]
MKLTTKSEYAIRALLDLARATCSRGCRISEISARSRIPKKYLEHILLRLKGAGIVRSKVGLGGYYVLARPASDIRLGEVVRLMDGPLAPVACASVTAYRPCDKCPDERSCGLRTVWREVRNAIAAILDSTTIADVIQRSHQLQYRPGPVYQI